MTDTDRLARELYTAWCRAQNADPRPWGGPDALPEHRKHIWRAVAREAEEVLRGPVTGRVVRITARRESA